MKVTDQTKDQNLQGALIPNQTPERQTNDTQTGETTQQNEIEFGIHQDDFSALPSETNEFDPFFQTSLNTTHDKHVAAGLLKQTCVLVITQKNNKAHN